MDGRPPRPPGGRNKRRDSVFDATTVFQNSLQDTIMQLTDIWDKCGMTDDVRGERIGAVYMHLKSLLHEMLHEEKEMLDGLQTRIDKYLLEIGDLHTDLCLPPFEQAASTLLEQERELKEAVTAARKIRDDRTGEAEELRNRDSVCCRRLAMTPFHLPKHPKIPTEHSLADFREHVAQREAKLTELHTEYEETAIELKNIYRRLKKTPEGTFEAEVVNGQEFQMTDVVLSDENMYKLRTLLGEARTEYGEYIAELRGRIVDVKNELYEWWEKCHVDEAHKLDVPVLDEETFTEDVFELYLLEIEKWKRYFKNRQAVLAKVDEWSELWKEKIALEEHESDPERYKNRGGNLAKELQRNNDLERKLLPKARADVGDAVKEWNKTHPSEPIFLHGQTPVDWIDGEIERRKEAKLIQKKQRLQAEQKKRQCAEETLWGVGSVQSTPGRTPGGSLKRKAQPSPVRPGTACRPRPPCMLSVGSPARLGNVRPGQGSAAGTPKRAYTPSRAHLESPMAARSPATGLMGRQVQSTAALKPPKVPKVRAAMHEWQSTSKLPAPTTASGHGTTPHRYPVVYDNDHHPRAPLPAESMVYDEFAASLRDRKHEDDPIQSSFLSHLPQSTSRPPLSPNKRNH